MNRLREPTDYLELGDRLLKQGELKSAAQAYASLADAWLAENFLKHARSIVGTDPLTALKSLKEAERLGGPTCEGRTLLARAYEVLGQPEIARRFRLSA